MFPIKHRKLFPTIIRTKVIKFQMHYLFFLLNTLFYTYGTKTIQIRITLQHFWQSKPCKKSPKLLTSPTPSHAYFFSHEIRRMFPISSLPHRKFLRTFSIILRREKGNAIEQNIKARTAVRTVFTKTASPQQMIV